MGRRAVGFESRAPFEIVRPLFRAAASRTAPHVAEASRTAPHVARHPGRRHTVAGPSRTAPRGGSTAMHNKRSPAGFSESVNAAWTSTVKEANKAKGQTELSMLEFFSPRGHVSDESRRRPDSPWTPARA